MSASKNTVVVKYWLSPTAEIVFFTVGILVGVGQLLRMATPGGIVPSIEGFLAASGVITVCALFLVFSILAQPLALTFGDVLTVTRRCFLPPKQIEYRDIELGPDTFKLKSPHGIEWVTFGTFCALEGVWNDGELMDRLMERTARNGSTDALGAVPSRSSTVVSSTGIAVAVTLPFFLVWFVLFAAERLPNIPHMPEMVVLYGAPVAVGFFAFVFAMAVLPR